MPNAWRREYCGGREGWFGVGLGGPEASALWSTKPAMPSVTAPRYTVGPEPTLWPYSMISHGDLPAAYSQSRQALMSFLQAVRGINSAPEEFPGVAQP